MVGSYSKLYEEYIRICDLYLSKQHLFEKPPYTNSDDTLRVDFHQTRFELKKPIYSLYSSEISKQQHEKNELLKEYAFEKNQLIHKNKSDLSEMKRLTKLLADNNQRTTELQDELLKKKGLVQAKLTSAENARSVAIQDKKNLYESILNTNDDILQKKDIDRYLNMNFDEGSEKNETNLGEMVAIEDLLVSKHVMIHNDGDVDSKSKGPSSVTEKKPKLTAKSKLENKIKEKLQNPNSKSKTETEVKTELKKNILKGIFGSLSDCKSTKHSKPYYLNKTQIYALIEKDPNLKKKVGKMYKKLSRDDLCDKLIS